MIVPNEQVKVQNEEVKSDMAAKTKVQNKVMNEAMTEIKVQNEEINSKIVIRERRVNN